MLTLMKATATTLSASAGQPPARPQPGLGQRLRRWFDKLRQYGRDEMEFDLRGLLHLNEAALAY